MPFIVTPLYAGILALIYVYLAIRVVALRRKFWISIGDKGNEQLLRQQRVHGNFAEYVPLCLLLMLFTELQIVLVWATHALGAALVAGRILHALGVGREPESLTMRTYGMLLTFAVLIVGGLLNIVYYFLMMNFAG
ncbi:MAPEG family protein [Roseibium litorale]|uniref:MAPEG family protein n=1 Tax=Roseibium litorale TaxID=2803841 RepID=A0ABR9CN14_9HYPH|nr:MAPEG family protein [Roseibium litorale]MBD8892264.1 MAPEG family protein [Roseibium litorale]